MSPTDVAGDEQHPSEDKNDHPKDLYPAGCSWVPRRFSHVPALLYPV